MTARIVSAPRRIAVTGAGQPLGMAMVRALLESGDRVAAITPRPERVPALGDLAEEFSARLEVFAGDGSEPPEASAVMSRVGSVDALIHSALRRHATPGLVDAEAADSLGSVDEVAFVALTRANAWSTVAWTRAAVGSLAGAMEPRVLITVPWLASISGKSRGGDYAYCASLAARHMVARALAADLAPQGIAVIGVNPGNYKTEIEGPTFQHSVLAAADGVVAQLARSTQDAGKWFDWTGEERRL